MPSPLAVTLVLLVIVAAAAYTVFIFNRLVALSARADNAWSDIDVQLRKRHDLVPRLVETVSGYATHEQSTLENVVEARAGATAAHGPADQAAAETRLNQGFARLIAVAEAYPDLKADDLFRSLHDQLIDVEDDLESARRYYNAVVRDLNTLTAQFPSSLVAQLTGRRRRDFFELTDLAHAGVPMVRFKETDA